MQHTSWSDVAWDIAKEVVHRFGGTYNDAFDSAYAEIMSRSDLPSIEELSGRWIAVLTDSVLDKLRRGARNG